MRKETYERMYVEKEEGKGRRFNGKFKPIFVQQKSMIFFRMYETAPEATNRRDNDRV